MTSPSPQTTIKTTYAWEDLVQRKRKSYFLGQKEYKPVPKSQRFVTVAERHRDEL